MLDGFKLVDNIAGSFSMSVTRNGVTFNKATILKLNSPSYVQLYINQETHEVAIVSCSPESEQARPFLRKGKDPTNGVRWNNYDLRTTFETMMGWTLTSGGMRTNGSYSVEDNAIIFDLNKAVPVERGNNK